MAKPSNLKKAIEESQISLSEIATNAKVERTTLYRWVAQNRVPKHENRVLLANALKVSVESIPGGGTVNAALPLATFGSLEEITNETWIELLDAAEHLDVYSSGTASALLNSGSDVLDTLRYRANRESLKVRLVLADPTNEHSGARLEGFEERAVKSLQRWKETLDGLNAEIRTHHLPMGSATFDFGHRVIATSRFNASPVACITGTLFDSGHPSWKAAKGQFEFAYGESEEYAD